VESRQPARFVLPDRFRLVTTAGEGPGRLEFAYVARLYRIDAVIVIGAPPGPDCVTMFPLTTGFKKALDCYLPRMRNGLPRNRRYPPLRAAALDVGPEALDHAQERWEFSVIELWPGIRRVHPLRAVRPFGHITLQSQATGVPECYGLCCRLGPQTLTGGQRYLFCAV
jgi:hypothetical protein